jgi:hypothetical protein
MPDEVSRLDLRLKTATDDNELILVGYGVVIAL